MQNSLKVLFGLTLAAAFALGLAYPQVAGANPVVVEAPSGAARLPGALDPMSGTPPDLSMSDSAINPEAFAQVVELNEKMERHMYVDENGLVQLADVTAAEIGVTEEFLANFKAALVYSNEAIASGDIIVNADLTVETSDKLMLDFDVREGPGNETGFMPESIGDGGAVPQWGAWNYPSGAIFFNSYNDWTYYRTSYYGLCNTMAAYLGLPWMSRSLVYFYGYNQSYFSRYCYTNQGMYYYMPYSYCRTNLGYKPMYFWARTYAFNYGCYCYQYQWQWQGYWGRY